ncbi:MAG: hypothetical protein IJB50_02875, partial [Clostridia bacterium]|nr:hypothetical protein [Clostridia bacterium]
MITGTIIKGIGGFYYVKSDDGIYSCRARGKFRKEKEKRHTLYCSRNCRCGN